METKLRLRYFPFPGRAGPIRDTFLIGGIPFEDVHISFEQFAEQKAAGKLPFGSLPVLDVISQAGEVSAAQSNAILRFVGRQAGLYIDGDPLRALKIDEAMDLGEEFYHLIAPSINEGDPVRRAGLRKLLAEETLPIWGKFSERILVSNGQTGFVVGGSLTVADLKLFWVMDKLTNGTLDGVPTTVFNCFEAIVAWKQNITVVRDNLLAAAAAKPR